ncbi:MAG: (Fe-S)-binding protein [Eubacteriales bacterium]
MDAQLQEKLTGVLKQKINRQMLYYLDVCTKCGICKDACHIYRATGRPEHLPSYRAEVLRRIYKGKFDLLGKILPALHEVRELDERALEELFQAAYTCTGCRRCMVYCPFGIDITWMLGAAKALLVEAGRAPEVLEMLTDAAIEKGKSMDFYKDIIVDQIKGLEPELRKRTGIPDATIPMDKKGADILYVALGGTHTILPAAIIFTLAGENWTLSMFEGSNYGYFLGDTARAAEVAERIVTEAKELGVKEIVVTECGHTYRVMKHLDEIWSKQTFPFKISSIFEPFSRYIAEGRIKVDPNKITGPVTYHDPCQLGRNGGIFEEPRYVVKAISKDYREMMPNRGKNWCCGGGGGLVAQTELEEFRAVTGKMKAEQIAATGAKIVATPCENCRLQLALINERYNLNINVSAVMDLVVEALVLNK